MNDELGTALLRFAAEHWAETLVAIIVGVIWCVGILTLPFQNDDTPRKNDHTKQAERLAKTHRRR